MKTITAYQPETQEELDYILTFGQPNQEVQRLTNLLSVANNNYINLKAQLDAAILELNNIKNVTPVPPSTNDLYVPDFSKLSISGSNLVGWDKTKLPFVESIYFNNSGGGAFAFQEFRTDNTKPVLYSRIIDDDPATSGTSRAQMTVDHKSDLPVVHTSHRIKLHQDIASLVNYPGTIRWFTLFELWNLRDNTQGGDPAGSSRISLSLFKDSTGPLYWHIAYEEMQPSEKVVWQQKSTAVIPFGKWFTMDIFVKRGDANTGKFKLVITEDGGVPVTVFDITNNNIYRNKPELYINQWQVFKLYSSDQIMDWARNNAKELSIMYADLKWLTN